MAKYRQNLPQLSNQLFLTDGGIETTFIYHNGIDLPYFAVFDQLKSEKGTQALRDYYSRHAAIFPPRAMALGVLGGSDGCTVCKYSLRRSKVSS